VSVLSEGRARPGYRETWQDAALVLLVILVTGAAFWIATYLLFRWLA
jgi:preprotein translocase subunit SecE